MSLDAQLAALAAEVGADIKTLRRLRIQVVDGEADTPDPALPYIKMTDPPTGEINDIWMGTREDFDALPSRPSTTAHFVFRPEDL